MRTRLDVVTRALRRIGVAAHDEAPTADQIDNAGAVYDALLIEIGAETGTAIYGDSVDEAVFVPLANLLAVEIAPDFGVAMPTTRGAALIRLLGVLRPDYRTYISEPEYF